LAAAEVDIADDAKAVFSPRTVLDWPTFRAVVDSEIIPLFDLFLGLSAWMPVYSLQREQRNGHQELITASIRDDLIHVIVNSGCIQS